MRIGRVLSPLSRAVPHVRDQPRVQRFPAGGAPRSFGWCSALAHSADPTLPRPPSTAKTMNTVASRPPLLAQRLAHPVSLIPQGPIARRPPRLPKGSRSSEPDSVSRSRSAIASDKRNPTSRASPSTQKSRFSSTDRAHRCANDAAFSARGNGHLSCLATRHRWLGRSAGV